MPRPHFEVPPTYGPDPVIESYKEGVDFSLVRENLELTVDQRIRRLGEFVDRLDTIRGEARERRERAIRDTASSAR